MSSTTQRDCDTPTRIVRRSLFNGNLLDIGYVAAKPLSATHAPIEHPEENVLAFPLAGVFAKHDGPRRHVIATANHAVLFPAGSPYSISFPGGIGDECLTIRFSRAALARVLPGAMSKDAFDSSAFATCTLLPASIMLARSLLWRRLADGQADPLEVEEFGIDLCVSALHAAAHDGHHGMKRMTPYAGDRRLRQIERVKEAISIFPERKWTLANLSDLACISPYHLAHVFRREVGTSVYDYVLRSRLGRALDVVLDSNQDLIAIALEYGFASHSHFTARFRTLFGTTPHELRRVASNGMTQELRKIVTAKARETA